MGKEKAPDTYSSGFAFIYIFNLIVGTGALVLPQSFANAGVILSTIMLVIMAFVSYVSFTYMVEAMAAANAYTLYKSRKRNRASVILQRNINIMEYNNNKSMKIAILSSDDYEIKKKFEMGTLANMFFKPSGIILCYFVLCLYLYGKLAVNAVIVPKSIVVIVCTKHLNDTKDNIGNFDKDLICFGETTQLQFYYILLAVFSIVTSPWAFFKLSLLKYLHIVTMFIRSTAFFFMIIIAIIEIAEGDGIDPNKVEVVCFENLGALFGICIHAFLFHQYIPGIITPMKEKKQVSILVFFNILFVLCFYLLLSYTGAFRYSPEKQNDIYTLNFFTGQFSTEKEGVLSVLGYYLALYPVFTLTLNFPVVSITLCENLKALTLVSFKLFSIENMPFYRVINRFILFKQSQDEPFHRTISLFFFPFISVVPPLWVAFVTTNVQSLINFTGTYFGAFIQYVIPVTLAFAGKYIITKKMHMKYENKYESPFNHNVFLASVLVWTIICLIVTSSGFIIKASDM